MGEIVNLRRARKAAARAADQAEAAANRIRHGRPRAMRDAEAQTAARQRHALDGRRLDRGDGDAAPPGGAPSPAPDHGD